MKDRLDDVGVVREGSEDDDFSLELFARRDLIEVEFLHSTDPTINNNRVNSSRTASNISDLLFDPEVLQRNSKSGLGRLGLSAGQLLLQTSQFSLEINDLSVEISQVSTGIIDGHWRLFVCVCFVDHLWHSDVIIRVQTAGSIEDTSRGKADEVESVFDGRAVFLVGKTFLNR